mmetsp:Transcript_23405/g.69255  ORF Transcript_23405/g.69255 Transcript_23405/m.69255 type:complete len:82 (-) Transcript_23405:836-1081(-)
MLECCHVGQKKTSKVCTQGHHDSACNLVKEQARCETQPFSNNYFAELAWCDFSALPLNEECTQTLNPLCAYLLFTIRRISI